MSSLFRNSMSNYEIPGFPKMSSLFRNSMSNYEIPGFPKMSSLFRNSMSNYEINGDYKTFCKYFPVSFTYNLYIYNVHESTS